MADKTANPSSIPSESDPADAASQLSALIDDELQTREIALILRRLNRDQDLQVRWERYHLISDVLQGHLPDAFDQGFAERIRQAVETEPLPQPVAKPLSTWYKQPAAGLGLAASVLLMTTLGFNLTPGHRNTLSTSTTPSLAAIPANFAASSPKTGNPRESAEIRLNNYLVNHNNYASLNSMPGMLPYVRLVGYQTSR